MPDILRRRRNGSPGLSRHVGYEMEFVSAENLEQKWHVAQPVKAVINSPNFELNGGDNKGFSEVCTDRIHLEWAFFEDKVVEFQLMKDRKSTRLNSSHSGESRMPSSA